jgi:hypothetical protein
MECAEADARAFAKLLQRLKDFDADHSTVLMIQVENKCRIQGNSRDSLRWPKRHSGNLSRNLFSII